MGQTNYAASKAGVIGLTKALAKELARDGVRVHCVLPGFINTPMAEAVPDKVLAQMKAQIPLGRFGEASEVASLQPARCGEHVEAQHQLAKSNRDRTIGRANDLLIR